MQVITFLGAVLVVMWGCYGVRAFIRAEALGVIDLKMAATQGSDKITVRHSRMRTTTVVDTAAALASFVHGLLTCCRRNMTS